MIEDVDVTDTHIDGPRSVGLWRTILAGVPSPRNLALTLLTFLINLACVTMVADRLYSEHMIPTEDLSFVRPGFISDKEVKFLVREADQTKMPVVFEIRVKENESPFSTDEYLVAGKVQSTSDDTDYTAVVDLALNHHSQRTYEWRTSNGHSGEFTSAPEAGKYPDKFDGKFTFLSTSCIINRLPYNPLDHPLSILGMRYLSNVLPELSAQFMLFLGDFIYADVPREWGESAADVGATQTSSLNVSLPFSLQRLSVQFNTWHPLANFEERVSTFSFTVISTDLNFTVPAEV